MTIFQGDGIVYTCTRA